jgi:hypothetical protein
MTRAPIITERDGCRIWEMPPPEGWVVIDTYHPHTCPWDVYGNRHVREVLLVLRDAGITEMSDCPIRHSQLHPQGTDPGGRVRLGDDWLPGIYRVAVPPDQVAEAGEALARHREAVRRWLDGVGPMPVPCGG